MKKLAAGIHPLAPHLQGGGQYSSGLSSTAGGGVSAGAAVLITTLMHAGHAYNICKVQVPGAALAPQGCGLGGQPGAHCEQRPWACAYSR